MQTKHPSIASIGRAIRERRLALGLSQEEMAERAGVHRTYYSSVERGAYNITMIVLFRIAVGLECEPGELLPERKTLKKLPPVSPARGRRKLS